MDEIADFGDEDVVKSGEKTLKRKLLSWIEWKWK